MSAASYPDLPLIARQQSARAEIRPYLRDGYRIAAMDANGVTYTLEAPRPRLLARLWRRRAAPSFIVISVDRFGKVLTS